MLNQYQYLNQFLPSIEMLRTKEPQQMTEEEYNKFYFGSSYLGRNLVKCDYCKDNAVEIKGYFESHVCVDCQLDLANLQ